ncbi:MAG: SDR family oxidoreductase [Deltaproteobacteria bacterium]|nr:SDR family oxidoreductase [Deltaproteobacteria bacterium]
MRFSATLRDNSPHRRSALPSGSRPAESEDGLGQPLEGGDVHTGSDREQVRRLGSAGHEDCERGLVDAGALEEVEGDPIVEAIRVDPDLVILVEIANPLRLGHHRHATHGDQDECADVALFLASSLSSSITGQVLPVDGGNHLCRLPNFGPPRSARA